MINSVSHLRKIKYRILVIENVIFLEIIHDVRLNYERRGEVNSRGTEIV